jgi:RNA polymerase sigma-70 factor (ECF subfamily)
VFENEQYIIRHVDSLIEENQIFIMNTHLTQTEASLISGCLAGDRKQQKALYDLYSPKLYAVCLRYAKNEMDAEDILQDGFVKLFNNLHKYAGEGSFEGWVRRIFVNTAIEHLRRRKIETTDCDKAENKCIDRTGNGLDNLYKMDLVRSIKSLSTGYQTVFNLYAVQGFSHQEIANQLGISESTSKSQFSRAKAMLRTMIGGR